MSTTQKYKLSFVSGGLLAKESVAVAATFLEVRDWVQTRVVVRERNLVQQRTDSSVLRVSREVANRLATLTSDELEVVVAGTSTEREQLMWSAVCRQYELIAEFAREVLRERYVLLAPTLSYDEYDSFIRSKALWHNELDALKPLTLRKLRATLFRMLREAGLLSESLRIVPPLLTSRVKDLLIKQGGAVAFTVYPLSDTDIERISGEYPQPA